MIDLWYDVSTNKGRFYRNDVYSMNEEETPALIELFESYKELR